MERGYNAKPTGEEIINEMQNEINMKREEDKKLYRGLEEKELENKELKEMNQKLMLMPFPEATEHFKKMFSSIVKTIKESGANG